MSMFVRRMRLLPRTQFREVHFDGKATVCFAIQDAASLILAVDVNRKIVVKKNSGRKYILLLRAQRRGPDGRQ